LARSRNSALLQRRTVESILVPKLSRSLMILSSNVINIVLTWTRNSNRMCLIIQLHCPVHCVLFCIFARIFLLMLIKALKLP
jgi:hypothetical protein